MHIWRIRLRGHVKTYVLQVGAGGGQPLCGFHACRRKWIDAAQWSGKSGSGEAGSQDIR